MMATRRILRGASLTGLLTVLMAVGGWGRTATLPVTPIEKAQKSSIVSDTYQFQDQSQAPPLLLVRSHDDAAGGLGVNAFLWRASLATLSFMPLATVDPVGGVIITDWYANPQVPNERFKMIVYILDRRLRADGVKVAVFRQVRNAQSWVDAAADPETGTKLENAILTRARQFKVDAEQ